MLAIRMQRTGRKGHAMFRVVVQDARRTPTSGKIVALLGSYDPHAKALALDKEKAAFYVEHGAQPSERAARLLKTEGIKLPKWVVTSDKKSGKLRNQDKLRRNRPQDAIEAPAKEETATAEAVADPAAEAETKAEAEPQAAADDSAKEETASDVSEN